MVIPNNHASSLECIELCEDEAQCHKEGDCLPFCFSIAKVCIVKVSRMLSLGVAVVRKQPELSSSVGTAVH